MKAVIITGPTASGKTKLGLDVAKNYNGAVISVDSVQVYKGLDIISGKDIPKNTKKVVIHKNLHYYLHKKTPVFGIDVVDHQKAYSISKFHKDCQHYLSYISGRRMLPILVGGSPMYINSVLNPPDTLSVQPNLKLREELESKSTEYLQKMLGEIDPNLFERLNNSERNNTRRLIRKIEILASGEVEKDRGKKTVNDYLVIGLKVSKEDIKQKIHARVIDRLEQGAEEEAKTLFRKYNSLSLQVKNAIGYKDFFEHFQGVKSYEEAIKDWELHEMQLVKKQQTWFKKMDITWFDANGDDLFEGVVQTINNFLEG